jgi:protoporphyrin/coproporphyrin ferrochelatase
MYAGTSVSSSWTSAFSTRPGSSASSSSRALILPKRPHESAEAYRSIWWDEGSPLIVISRRVEATAPRKNYQPHRARHALRRTLHRNRPARIAGTWWPALREILVVPLYPHYAMSSFETAVVAAREALARIGSRVRLTVLPPFYQRPPLHSRHGRRRPSPPRTLRSRPFQLPRHPERHLRKTDPTGRHCLASPDCCETPSPAHEVCYRAQTRATTASSSPRPASPGKYSISYQSRLGRDPWLKPYTDFEFVRLAKEGVRRLVVLSPPSCPTAWKPSKNSASEDARNSSAPAAKTTASSPA